MSFPTPYTSLHQNDDFGLTVSNEKYSVSLSDSADTTLTVPGSASRFKAVMRAHIDGLVYFANNETAEFPNSSSFQSTTSELIPINSTLCREVKAGDILHFITEQSKGVNVSVVFYAII